MYELTLKKESEELTLRFDDLDEVVLFVTKIDKLVHEYLVYKITHIEKGGKL